MDGRKSFVNHDSISDYETYEEVQDGVSNIIAKHCLDGKNDSTISIPEKTLHKLSQILESHFMSQVKTMHTILSHSPEAIHNKCLCKRIVPLFQQLFSETVASGQSTINLFKSFTTMKLSSTFEDFIKMQNFYNTAAEQISLPNIPEEVHNILRNNPTTQQDSNPDEEPSNLLLCKIEENSNEIPEVYIDKDNPEIICDVENFVKVELQDNSYQFEKIIENEEITNQVIGGSDDDVCDDFIQNTVLSQKSKRRKRSMRVIKKDLYSCSYCRKKYKSRGSFIKHERTHEDIMSTPDMNNTDESSDQNSVTDNTEESLIEFKSVKNMAFQHTAKELENGSGTQISNKQLSCEICDKSFANIATFKQHKACHESKKDLSCKYCDQVFKTKSKHSLHLRTHTGERPFICEVCGASFIRRSGLYEHQFTHSKEKPFSCSQCDYKCRTQKILNFHLIVHSNEKSFQCDECGKTFSRGINLRHHLYTHAEVRPFPCNVCEKRFVTKCQLKRHRRIHENNLPYSCEICGKKSTQSYNIVVHMRTHTGQKPFSCEICGKTFAHNVTLRQHRNICDGSNDIRHSKKNN